MNDKGAELNERVWRLFERAGFQTSPSSHNLSEEVIKLSPGRKRTVDLCAIDEALDVKIIGWNKARKDLKESLTVHIHDYEKLRDTFGANSVLFVLTEKEVSKEDQQYVEERRMRIWGEDELRYYELLVDAIGGYAKYEIIRSFGIDTDEEKVIHTALALRIHQPFSQSDTDLFLFTTTPDRLLKTCAVLRRARGSADAYQRMLRKHRLSGIQKFVTMDNALLPPNIIVHFSDRVKWDSVKTDLRDANDRPIVLARERNCELVALSIPMEYASLELIDGQHRLYGFAGTEPATRESFNLVVLGMAGLPFEKRRDVFVAINDKARRVDPNLVAYLKHTDDETKCQQDTELMAIKIVVELNETTPFKRRIRIIDFGNQTITLKGFSGYDLRGLLGPRGLFRKHYPNESQEYVSALRLYFRLIKSFFKEECRHPEKYIIFTNRGISAFLKLLKSILRTCECPLDEDTVKKYLLALKDNWTDGWETSELKNSYVGSKGWKDFHRDLVSAIRKPYPDFRE